ncbi:hypothetical protein Smp_182060 [Schistosoma mansoni]|uniref:hypothetical protein n=1 Tax=Schistosoma mansoni TaxID=6183 RepID=UPI00022DC1AA|nr:hypothetical protein Smp_182060 [Schistosoma mansoni]|eukprot:XP_018652820.1 hypothetical protein Smp_182060 [Schistosoma mansoni]
MATWTMHICLGLCIDCGRLTLSLYLPVLNKRIDCTVIPDFCNVVRDWCHRARIKPETH